MSRGGVDYSKWNNLDASDSEGSAEGYSVDDDDEAIGASLSSAEKHLLARGITYDKDPTDGWLIVGVHKNIYIYPDDPKIASYSEIIFFEDPYTYIPDPSLYDEGRVNKWGLIEPPVNEVDSLSRMMLNLTCGTGNSIKYEGRGLVGMPDQQFIKILIDRKLDYIVTEEVQAAKKFTYVIRIELCGCEKDVWRRIKVPSAIDLSKLQDQVICPVMGWGRGYHGYVFEDPKGMYYKCRGIKNKEPNPAVYVAIYKFTKAETNHSFFA